MRAEKNTQQQMLRAHTHRVFISSGNSGAAALNMFTHDGLDGGHRNHTHTHTQKHAHTGKTRADFFFPRSAYVVSRHAAQSSSSHRCCAHPSAEGYFFFFFKFGSSSYLLKIPISTMRKR